MATAALAEIEVAALNDDAGFFRKIGLSTDIDFRKQFT
jgi:hypothetical protein